MEVACLSLTVIAMFGIAFETFFGVPSAIVGATAMSYANYQSLRDEFVRAERNMAFGSGLRLQPDERVVNDILMRAKHNELAKGFQDPSTFPPARNFLTSIDEIENSEVFKMIVKMPKGGVLHVHSTSLASQDYVFNLTYRENFYVCEAGEKPGEKLSFRFFETPNENCDWRLLSDLRRDSTLEKHLNARIRGQLSMNDSGSRKIDNYDGQIAWTKFESIHESMSEIIQYRPVHDEHFNRGLRELMDDNVIYLELRATLHSVYELNGTVNDPINVARSYKTIAENFCRDNPKFLGVRLIYAPSKTSNPDEFDEYFKIAMELTRSLPNFFVGFDLVGHEDALPRLYDWTEKLLTVFGNFTFFFHAGETNWNGLTVDDNLIDAVLMNSKRIGHGYALTKHPKVLELMRTKKIAVEICPISNQILGLVGDLRNHPATGLFVDDYPLIVSNDDPGMWGAKGLSHDFYEAFMGMMSAHADIRSIKQLAINSIEYSSMNDTEKIRALSIWNEQWNVFIRSFYSDN